MSLTFLTSGREGRQEEILNKTHDTHNLHTQAGNSMIMQLILKQENFFKKPDLFSGFQFLCIYVICCGHDLKETREKVSPGAGDTGGAEAPPRPPGGFPEVSRSQHRPHRIRLKQTPARLRWLGWLVGISPRKPKRSPVRFPVRTHAWVTGSVAVSVPVRVMYKRKLIDVSLSHQYFSSSLPSPLCKNT